MRGAGLAALMLERNPALKPGEVRAILMKTARDLGPPGPDDQFGAGEADAFAAVSAVSAQMAPVAEVSDRPATKEVSDTPNASTTRALSLPSGRPSPPQARSSPLQAKSSPPRSNCSVPRAGQKS